MSTALENPPSTSVSSPAPSEQPSNQLINLEDDPFTRTIIERALAAPKSLRDVPIHVRAYRQWWRDLVAYVVKKNSLAIDEAPELWEDNQLRRFFDWMPLHTEEDRMSVRRIRRCDPRLFENLRDGIPQVEARSSLYLPENAPTAICHACNTQSSLYGEVLGAIDSYPTLLSRVCGCRREVFETVKPEILLEVACKGSWVNGNGKEGT